MVEGKLSAAVAALKVHERKLINAAYLTQQAKERERASVSRMLKAEAACLQLSSRLQCLLDEQEASDRAAQIAKIKKRASNLKQQLEKAESQVRLLRSSPTLKHPVAGLHERRNLEKWEKRLEALQKTYKMEIALLSNLEHIEAQLCKLWDACNTGIISEVEACIRQ